MSDKPQYICIGGPWDGRCVPMWDGMERLVVPILASRRDTYTFRPRVEYRKEYWRTSGDDIRMWVAEDVAVEEILPRLTRAYAALPRYLGAERMSVM